MTYGAKESNTTEGTGLALVITGLILLTAGWAYGVGVVQLVLMLLGLVGFVGGFVVLRMARIGTQLTGKS